MRRHDAALQWGDMSPLEESANAFAHSKTRVPAPLFRIVVVFVVVIVIEARHTFSVLA